MIQTVDHDKLSKPRPPSLYGYDLGKRQGIWCKRCADRYLLHKAYPKFEGTFGEWFFITRENLHDNFQCSLCAVIIREFSFLGFYKRWGWYNRLYYICKDLKHLVYNRLGYQSILQKGRKIKIN